MNATFMLAGTDHDTSERVIARGREVIRIEAQALGRLEAELGDSFHRACEMILRARQRVVVTGMGKSGHIARKIVATFAATGTAALFIHPAEAAHGDMGMLVPGDVLLAVSNSGNTAELRVLLDHARALGVGVIGMAARAGSMVLARADVALCLPASREACAAGVVPTTSTALQQAMGDALAMAVMDMRGFGGNVLMTSPACRNGTERCAQALAQLGDGFDCIVNLQGDAPLTPPGVVAAVVDALARDGEAAMATAALPCSEGTYAHLAADAAAGRVGGTTVVVNAAGHALYFSKRMLPFVPDGAAARGAVRLHLGVYAYRPAALRAYAAAAPALLEELEGLEQLRFLDAGAKVRVVTLDPPGWDCVELNNPEDVPVIERILETCGIA